MYESDMEVIIELLRDAIGTENWDKVDEAFQLLTADLSSPFDGYDETDPSAFNDDDWNE